MSLASDLPLYPTAASPRPSVSLADQIAEAEQSFAEPPRAETMAATDRRVLHRAAIIRTLRWLEANEARIRAALKATGEGAE